MTFYCPECGSEVTDGVKCPDCGHVDEDCSKCGNSLEDTAWYCGECETPRDICIECGTELDGDNCPNCDTVRPNLCDSCGELIERGTMKCGSCGHELGGKFRSRAKKTKYAGTIIAALLILFLLPGLLFGISSLQGSRRPIVMIIGLIIPIIGFPAIVIGISRLLARRYNKKAKQEVY